MGKYAAVHQTPVGTNLTIINVIGTAAIRCKIFEIQLGSDATPADIATEFNITRTTAVGTGGTGLTISPLDPLTVAATGTATGGTFGVEPTYGSNILLEIGVNQRAAYRWFAAPGNELICVASASNGLGLRSINSGGTPNYNATIQWEE